MNIKSINLYNCPFSSKKTFKKKFDTCTYSGEKFKQHDTKTIEHIIPLSLGGKNEYSNYLVVKRSWNGLRSSIPLREFISKYPQTKDNIIRTVSEHEGEIIEGINWSCEVKKTLKHAIGFDIFSEKSNI